MPRKLGIWASVLDYSKVQAALKTSANILKLGHHCSVLSFMIYRGDKLMVKLTQIRPHTSWVAGLMPSLLPLLFY